ncbi:MULTISPECIES: hypothetical protein [Aphanothece]|uniref:hypothetical protein n=1 Tax=Aphanothece TaxID=1121 RepID=UPI00398569DD
MSLDLPILQALSIMIAAGLAGLRSDASLAFGYGFPVAYFGICLLTGFLLLFSLGGRLVHCGHRE